MKKKLLFTAYSMNVGGIEKALINLLNILDYNLYEVTLILEKKEGIFLDLIPKEVNVLEYKISDSKFILFRKVYNRLKLWKWKNRLNKKFDFSCSFCTYSIPGAHLALCASNNNALWMHGNYYILYDRDEEKLKKYLNGVFAKNFKKIVFVSEENRRDICNHYQGIDKKSIVCNNFIDGDDILEKAKEDADFTKTTKTLFVNVGRHDEYQKRLSRIIEASKRLIEEGYKFEIMFIGDGPDSLIYDDMIKTYKLDKVIYNLGRRKNPYPYYKIADAVILSSEYEGFPVVFLESMIMEKPILSTKVSDWEDLDGKAGMFCDLNTEAVYKMMKDYLDNGFKLKEKFDYNEYNENIKKKILDIINK